MSLLKTVYPLDAWTLLAKEQAIQVSPYADAFIKRRGLGQTHAVHDFLFIYYSFSPQKLKQWIPSFEEGIEISGEFRDGFPWFNDYWFAAERGQAGDLLVLNRDKITPTVRGLAGFVSQLCENILQRPPRYGCFGLHEWAMVYKQTPEEIRHNKHSLRLAPDELAKFVESQTLCCSHYDAFRFFTAPARPLNTLNPQIENRLQMEQGGCVHANMDLYKWATKLWPWVGSEFIVKAFFLALEGRELDMRASPYDLAEEGYDPIRIETEEGRKQYQREQQQLTERSTPLRQELRDLCIRLSKV